MSQEKEFTPLAVPQVSLPKGGGALKGIEEKFQANPATGSASFSVPLPVGVGRNGSAQQLSLSYDSGSGNGPFGLGWSLSLPSLVRKTDKGLPLYHDAKESDEFQYSGVEDLVPLPEYDRLSGDFTVRRYAPRLEGSFSRIEAWTHVDTGIRHWMVRSRDNVLTVFGVRAESRIADPADARRVFRWYPDLTLDALGNLVRYDYKTDGSNTYLKRLLSGNRIPCINQSDALALTESDFLSELVFDYGEHSTSAPLPDDSGNWALRSDPFSNRRSCFEVRTSRLCQRVLLFHRFAELGTTPCLVKSLTLQYRTMDSGFTVLASATHKGHRKETNGTWSEGQFPPLQFHYAVHQWNGKVHEVDPTSLAGLPEGLAGGTQLLDLYGEGLQGILSESGSSWCYKRNLGDGQFSPAQMLAERPSTGHATAIQDLDGDNRKSLVDYDGAKGYYRLREDGGWDGPRLFKEMPRIDFGSPDVRFVDLDGDGRADILVDGDSAFVYYRSEGGDGFSLQGRLAKTVDERQGPRSLRSDSTHAIFLADMTGDGLSDLVRIRNGEVCYWPNLGHGRFGARIVMEGSPRFSSIDTFDPQYIKLADIDGSGPADLLYFDGRQVRGWLNESGNGWREATDLQREVVGFPGVDRTSQLQVTDFLGNGTACIVWSTPSVASQGRQVRYIDLMGGNKPYLLETFDSGMGKVVRLSYTPSTRFYLNDHKAGTPWVTKLPFPVHCLSRVETTEEVSGSVYASTYTYHHGYYDSFEREFRGFGRVDQRDTESYVASDTDQNPVLVKTWYHTGADLRSKGVLDHFAHEYNHTADFPKLPDPELPSNLAWDERREALRACKGTALRQETYEVRKDAEGKEYLTAPYLIVEKNCRILLHRAKGNQKHAIFLVTEAESLSGHYEQEVTDARLSHTLLLESNAYGQPLRTVTVSYGRESSNVDTSLPTDVQTWQKRTHVVVSGVDYTELLDDGMDYRLPVPKATRSWELTGVSLGSKKIFSISDFNVAKTSANTTELDFSGDPTNPPQGSTTALLRLVECVETEYWNDTLTGPRTDIDWDAGKRGLVYQSYALSYTAGVLGNMYTDTSGGQVSIDATLLAEGGYVQRQGSWWIPSGRNVYPTNASSHFYQPSGVLDPFGQTTTLERDSYDLLPVSVTDPLGNTVQSTNDYRTLSPVLVTDPNGNRTAVATDPLGMVSAMAVMGKASETVGDTLANPTVRYSYDLAVKPAWVKSESRETHSVLEANTRWITKKEYTDGLGRLAMAKVSAEPDSSGNPRWVGTGRTVFNNKGKPVEQYEPYFSHTENFEPEAGFVGVSPKLHYDALGRVIRTDFPDHTYSKVEFTPWVQKSFDQNDTSIDQPHYNTPTIAHLDSIGRTVCTQAHMGFDANNEPNLISTLVDLDMEGNEKSITDARNNKVMEYRYGIHGEKGYTKSMDAGKRWMFLAVDGKPIRTWDSRGHRLRAEFDALRRPTKQWLSENGATETLVGFSEYGELATNATNKNLLGKPWKIYDQSGLIENVQFDFKGNLVENNRQFVTAYSTAVDWNTSDLNALLNPEIFSTTTAFDALNRATSIITPSTSRIGQSEILPEYNEASLLEKVKIKPFGASIATSYVSNIDYNAKGQREKIVYGNGATTSYAYDEKSFRLTRLLTKRNSGAETLQDLNYTYDPVGNITQIRDDALQTLFYNGQVVSPTQSFEYDAQYRLLKATGREHVGNGSESEPNGNYPNAQSPMPADANALRNYTRHWEYDDVGNILSLIHNANNGNWTRSYAYGNDNNRLISTTVGQTTLPYTHNEHGSMSTMPHLSVMDWDFAERLSHVQKGNDHAYYTYDGSGQRVRKVVVKSGITEERLYLGGFEIFRKRVGNDLDFERATLHVMDDKKRIALVETKTVENGAVVASPSTVIRYQLDNHLGSASLELDESASVVSYEEYYPYGDTSYQAGRSASEVSQKRYRYTGKEKDEESGLYYHGARYYACWLGRWTASDPAGMVDGVNLYMYVRGNPVNGADSEGTSTDDVVRDVPESVQSVDDFRNWVFDEAGAYIDGDVTMERAEDGHPIFNYNNSDISVDQERRSEIEAERNRSFGSYLPGTAAGEEALEFYTNQIVEGERQGGFTGFMMQAGGYAGGIFSALWTPETATQTALTLGSLGIGSLAPAGSLIQKGLTLWGSYESSVSITEGITGTTSGVHAMDLGTWAWSGQYQGGQEMSGAERGLSFGLGGLGALGSMAGGAKLSGVPLVTREGFLLKGFQVNAPFDIPAQRFGSMSLFGENPWGLRIGSSLIANRGFAAIKPEWNPLTQYTQGTIPKGTPMKFGLIAPQSLQNFGGSLQFNVQSRSVVDQTSRMIQR